MSSQTIANLKFEALSSKVMQIGSKTLGENVGFLVSRGCKLHRRVLMFNQVGEP